MTPGVHSCLRVPADLAVVTFVRSAIAAVLAREEWPADGAARMLLASTEAVTNAIEHGSPLGGAVEVELTVTTERAQVRVLDEGRPARRARSSPTSPRRPPPRAAAACSSSAASPTTSTCGPPASAPRSRRLPPRDRVRGRAAAA